MVPRSAALLLTILSAPLAAEVRDLKAFYQQRCAVCHGADGTGRAADGARLGGRNLADARGLKTRQEDEWAATILRGKGAMPGFRRQISEAEARRLVTTVIRPRSAKRRPK